MPPKKELPQGLKDFLAKPENAKKRQEAIAKNKAVRAKKAEVKIVETINMEKGKQYLPKDSSDKKLLALKLSADKAKLPLPSELLNVIKEFTPKSVVSNVTFPQNKNGSYKAKEIYIDIFRYEKDFARFLKKESPNEHKKITKILEIRPNDIGGPKQIALTYMEGTIKQSGDKFALCFINNGKNLYPFMSSFIPTGGREKEFFPLEEIPKTKQAMIKKYYLGME
jgi:hypothetical protein